MEASWTQLEAVPEAVSNGHASDEPKVADNGHAPDQIEAVKGEILEDTKVVADWHGLALTLPPKLPASFMFEMTEAEVNGDDGGGGSYAVHTVYKLLGPEQWKQAQRHAEELGLSIDDFSDFISVVYQAYGMGGSGESSASSSGSDNGGG